MLNAIIQCLLIILLLLQICVLTHMWYINHKRSKEDEKFWNKLHAELDESTKVYLDKLDELDAKKGEESEQDK